MQVSRVYQDAAIKQPPEYRDYENLDVEYGYAYFHSNKR